MSKPVLIALLIAVLGCSQAPPRGSTNPQQAIETASRAFSDAYVRNDMEALGRLYTKDAVLLAPGRTITGREGAQKHFAWGPGFRQISHSMTSASLDIRGDTAVDTGTWHSTSQRGDDPATTASGAYLVVWVREQDGAWRMKYDMWHRPVPPPKP